MIVTLDQEGRLTCNYLGTDPAMFTTPTAEVREIDYAEMDYEMKELQRVIKEQQHKSVCEFGFMGVKSLRAAGGVYGLKSYAIEYCSEVAGSEMVGAAGQGRQ